MPQSSELYFYSNAEISEEKIYNKDIFALVLNFIEFTSPELSQKFHDEKQNKSITVKHKILNRNNLIIRLTLLNDNDLGSFSKVLLNSINNDYSLNKLSFKVSKIISSSESDSFWAAYGSYSDIYSKASKTEKRFRFKIISPLSFKKGDNYCNLPIPYLFFKSLHNKWNEFSEYKFPDEYLESIEKYVYDSFLEVKTDIVKITPKLTCIGSKGKIEYKVFPKADQDFVHYLNVLSDFAYFAGVGIKVSMGMGQVIRC